MKTKAKKSLGQNFLRDVSVCRRMVEAARVVEGDTVMEVGPGTGVLTKELLKTGARVIAVETDGDLLDTLRTQFVGQENFTLVHGDIRRVNIPKILAENKAESYKVVANLPYYITSSIIRLFLESQTPPTEMVLMVQKEVAERIVAPVGKMSVLSVAVRYYGRPEFLFGVPASSFWPQPKVQSAVIRIVRGSDTRADASSPATRNFFRVVRAGFSARRKKLLNNLANSLHIPKSEVADILAQLDISPTARAQELSVAQWEKLSRKFSEKQQNG